MLDCSCLPLSNGSLIFNQKSSHCSTNPTLIIFKVEDICRIYDLMTSHKESRCENNACIVTAVKL